MYYIIFYVYQCRIITTISILMDPPFKTFHIKLIVMIIAQYVYYLMITILHITNII